MSRRLHAAKDELARLQEEQQRAATAAQTVEVKCFPTPLSKTVDDDEVHFQLRGGRIAWVPMEDLANRFRADAEHKTYKLRDKTEITETIGPLGGFYLRYTLERRDMTEQDFRATGRAGSIVRLVGFELIPVGTELGETLEKRWGPTPNFGWRRPRPSPAARRSPFGSIPTALRSIAACGRNSTA